MDNHKAPQIVIRLPAYDTKWLRRFAAANHCRQVALFRFFVARVLRARAYGDAIVEDAIAHAWRYRQKERT